MNLQSFSRCVRRVHFAKIHFGNWSLKAVGHSFHKIYHVPCARALPTDDLKTFRDTDTVKIWKCIGARDAYPSGNWRCKFSFILRLYLTVKQTQNDQNINVCPVSRACLFDYSSLPFTFHFPFKLQKQWDPCRSICPKVIWPDYDHTTNNPAGSLYTCALWHLIKFHWVSRNCSSSRSIAWCVGLFLNNSQINSSPLFKNASVVF